MSSVNLKKGDVINLSKSYAVNLKKDSSLKTMDIALGWDTRCDLDTIAFLTDSNGVIKDTVYFGDKNKQGIFLNGDNLTGAGDGDDEIISVTFSALPSWVEKIQICVNVFSFLFKAKDFSNVKGAYVRLVDKDSNNELCRYDLNEAGAGFNAFHFANLIKINDEWTFEAIGQGMNGKVEQLRKQLTK